LALVDKDAIEADASGSGIGGYAYAERLRKSLTDEVRSKARELLHTFVETVNDAGVRHSGDRVSEDGLLTSLVTAMRTHDLLVTGRESHFYYHDPEKRTHTMAKVIEQAAAATLIVGKKVPFVRRVTIAYDGSSASARTLQKFVHLAPFGSKVEVEMLHVRGDSKEDQLESEALLENAKSYVEAYGFSPVVTTSLTGAKPADRIIEYATEERTDLLVSGAYAKAGLKRIVFGSSVTRLLESATIPLFLYR
jgi:nucleotide-binding universal stress UspA family protein